MSTNRTGKLSPLTLIGCSLQIKPSDLPRKIKYSNPICQEKLHTAILLILSDTWNRNALLRSWIDQSFTCILILYGDLERVPGVVIEPAFVRFKCNPSAFESKLLFLQDNLGPGSNVFYQGKVSHKMEFTLKPGLKIPVLMFMKDSSDDWNKKKNDVKAINQYWHRTICTTNTEESHMHT